MASHCWADCGVLIQDGIDKTYIYRHRVYHRSCMVREVREIGGDPVELFYPKNASVPKFQSIQDLLRGEDNSVKPGQRYTHPGQK